MNINSYVNGLYYGDYLQIYQSLATFCPPRTETESDSIKRPDYTIEDLLEQIPDDHSNNKKSKDKPFGPHRAEKGSNSIKRPDYTLKDLLDQVNETVHMMKYTLDRRWAMKYGRSSL